MGELGVDGVEWGALGVGGEKWETKCGFEGGGGRLGRGPVRVVQGCGAEFGRASGRESG